MCLVLVCAEMDHVSTHESFVHRPYVMLQHLVTSEVASNMYVSTRRFSARRVICDDIRISWTQRDVEPWSTEASFFQSSECMRRIEPYLGGTSAFSEVSCWTSEYGLGEHINPHVDKGGDLQVVLCLRSPAAENGGALYVRYKDQSHGFRLAAGDAMLFRATEVEHWTLPLVATPDDQCPERVVLCARYFRP